jgi:hypothetical protein
MKISNLCKGIASVTTASIVLASFVLPTKADVANRTYNVTIKNTADPSESVQACMRFDKANTLELVEPGDVSTSFTFARSNPSSRKDFRWQAISEGVAMHGSETPAGVGGRQSKLFNGNLITQDGNTFTFSGSSNNKPCQVEPQGQPLIQQNAQ